MTILDKLEEAKKTIEERGKIYGTNHDGFRKNGALLAALWPDGITIKGEEEFSRFILFLMVSVKLTRYAENLKKGGHKDSAHDAGLYSLQLEDFDDNCNNR